MRSSHAWAAFAGSFWLSLGACAPAAARVDPPHFNLTLRPLTTGSAAKISELEVSFVAGNVHAAAGTRLLQLPIVTSNVQTSALNIENLTVRDMRGPIPLVVHDDTSASDPVRQWIAGRAVGGEIRVRYRIPITDAPNPRGSAPPLELRGDGLAFSGSGSTFLLLPKAAVPYRIHLRWDLSGLPAHAAGLSSFGIGDVSEAAPLGLDRLNDAFYMGGLMGREPDRIPQSGFFGAWQGVPPFDARALMAWTEKLYGYDFDFFRPKTTHYGVFIRPNLVNAGGGRAFPSSFVGTFGPATDLSQFKGTLAHEMIHTFVGHLDNPNPVNGSAPTQDTSGEDGAWYAEGTAVFYQRLMPLRAGLMTPDQFLADLNFNAGRYYTNILNTLPEKEVADRFWEDTRIRTLPYDRGSFYLATVDAEIRKISGGRRSIDNLVLEMIHRHRLGRLVTQADWIELVTEELGPSAKREFEAMLGGAVMIPPSDAFGPCFRRIVRPLRRYEIGFDPKVLIDPARVVRGLVAGSAAEKAGLQNGDHIVKPVPQDLIQGQQDQWLTLEIKRGDRQFVVTYLPRGDTVPAYQWERIAGVPEDRCALPEGNGKQPR